MRQYHCKFKQCQFCKNIFKPKSSRQYHCSPRCSFWDKIEIGPPSECWIWSYGKKTTGYGELKSHTKRFLVHRFMWEEIYGKIPANMCVCHKCDNPLCVNPSHLFLGTIADNQQDMASKGRSTQGEKHPKAKLTNNDITDIRQLLSKGIYQKDVALFYNISQPAISLINTGRHWPHI